MLAAGDFAPRRQSPGVDAGLRLAVAGTTDLVGDERSQGTAIDIGRLRVRRPGTEPRRRRSAEQPVAIGELPWRSQSNGWGHRRSI